MNSNSKRNLILVGSIAGGHILALLILWFALSFEEELELDFTKVISVRITPTPLTALPPINQAERDEIAEEKRQKEEEERKKQEAEKRKKQESERKKLAAEKKKKDEARKKLTDNKKKDENKKKELAKLEKEKADKAKADAKKKAAAEAKKRADALRKKKAAADALRKKKAAAAKAAAAKAARIADMKRQGQLGNHAMQNIVNVLSNEWQRLQFSLIQFNDPSDVVKVRFTIRSDGRVLSAAIVSSAKNKALNSQMQKLIKTITSGNYRFPRFPAGYRKTQETFTKTFGAK